MSYYFELPAYGDLNPNQRLAVNETGPIALSGGPGTGKTVVSLWRHIRNYDNRNVNSLLLTYTKTLEHYLKGTARTRNEDASNFIDRTQRWVYNARGDYDEIIVDEAQDVGLYNYNTISSHCNSVSFGADNAQQVFDGCSYESLTNRYRSNEQYELQRNYRNSKEILKFVKAVFPDIFIDPFIITNSPSTGRKPILVNLGFNNFKNNAVDVIVSIINRFPQPTHNIGVLVASKNQVINYHSLLSNLVNCSKYYKTMPTFETLEKVHVSTFKSSKGLEFDTVIIPEFDSFNWFIENASNFSQNDYYVGLTRAKRNLFLLCKNVFPMNNYDTIEIR